MKDLTVFVGGSLGFDPYAAGTWSGSSRSLMQALGRAGVLDQAHGVNLSALQRAWFQLRNVSLDRSVWRRQFYMDLGYRAAMTRAAAALPAASPVLMQIGHWYSLPDAFPGKVCISYHDGNLAQSARSGFGMQGMPAACVENALLYEAETARKMTAVFTFSEYLRQSFIEDYGVPAERVLCVGGAVNLDTLPAADPHKDYSQPRLLFIGIDFDRKGGPLLLEAFRAVREAMPNAQLDIVGPASISTPLPEGVTLHGRLSKSDPAQKEKLESLFRASTLFVLPSLYEPFGIAPLEAMLYQLPCVLTDDWAFREFVTLGENGLLAKKGSAEDFAEKILQLLGNPEALPAMGLAARSRVLERYTWDAVVERMQQFFDTLY